VDLEKLTTEVKAVQPRARRFEVEPSEMYPAALADVQVALEENRAVSGALVLYKHRATQLAVEAVASWQENDDFILTRTVKHVDTKAWELALLPRDSITDARAVEIRAEALEIARLWFTERLHQFINHAPMELHILKDDDWRL
jgi:hypothetical protein